MVLFVAFAVSAFALWIWALSYSYFQKEWLLFAIGVPLGFLVAIWLLLKEAPLQWSDAPRLLINGAIITLSLIFPLWVTIVIFALLLMLEVQLQSSVTSSSEKP